MSDSGSRGWEAALEEQLKALGIPDSGKIVDRWKRIREKRIEAALRTVRQHRQEIRTTGATLGGLADPNVGPEGTTAVRRDFVAGRLDEVRDRLVDVDTRVLVASAQWKDQSESLSLAVERMERDQAALKEALKQRLRASEAASNEDGRRGNPWQTVAFGISMAVLAVVLGLMFAVTLRDVLVS